MRTVVAKLLILLMALHILVPAGFMLGRSGEETGGPTIVICKGDVFGALRLSTLGSDADPAQDHGTQSLCPYAPFGAVAVDAAMPKPVVLPITYNAIAFPQPESTIAHATQWRRPSARAPPFAA